MAIRAGLGRAGAVLLWWRMVALRSGKMVPAPLIHTCRSSPEGALVNAYLVETAHGVVAIDSQLTVSDSRALRGRLESLGKPLLAVLLTQSHPDHYGGLTGLVAGDEVPILAPQGVHDVIRRDDPLKEQILRPMFGDEWAGRRTFPNVVVNDRETVTFDGVRFTVIDLGPGESPHDSPWLLGEDERTVFLGDQIYDHMHCYLADGYFARWLANIEKLRRRFPDDAVLHVGHGGPVDASAWDWQQPLRARLQRLREVLAMVAEPCVRLTGPIPMALTRRSSRGYIETFVEDGVRVATTGLPPASL
jgi:glyoxylase-like metal-dependent hydrolase (beta-lactamase superfamily II)